jgi:hypothetical protein
LTWVSEFLIAAHEDSSSTEEYISDEEQLSLLTLNEVDEDLKNCETVRYYIRENFSNHTPINEELLRYPVLCVGTGRRPSEYLLKQELRPYDRCIDADPYLNPHLIMDAFDVRSHLLFYTQQEDSNEYFNDINNESLGCIFFAHVGDFPLAEYYEDDILKDSLALYCNKLIAGGYIIYNSFVYPSRDDAINNFYQRAGKNSFEELVYSVQNLFRDAGFTKVKLIIKDESKYFLLPSFSILILAQKIVH